MSFAAQRRDMVVSHPTALVKTRPETAPSKFGYRMERLWLTRWFRDMVRLWLPLGVLVTALYGGYTSPAISGWVGAQYQAMRGAVAARPALKISRISIPVGSPDLQRQILGIMNLQLPLSALDVDLAELRDLVQGLNAVKSASVRFEGGAIDVVIVERVPRVVWRNLNRVYLLDENGIMVAEVPRRAVRPDLPLVVGTGADTAMPEAREIFSVLAPLGGRVSGLVRMGARRWDVVLDNVVIKLPATGAADALRGLMAIEARDNLFDRDAGVVDLRNPDRMILRLNDGALNELRRGRAPIHGERV